MQGRQFIIITNNPMVSEYYGSQALKSLKGVTYLETQEIMAVYEKIRQLIHLGHELLTHPLSGSIKPGETPYKSVCLSASTGNLSIESLTIIEDCITMTTHLLQSQKRLEWPEGILTDFRTIDFHLIESGVQSILGR